MKNNYVFGKLFAEPSFVEGMSRVLDVGCTIQEYNTSETENKADIEALKNDWRAVGEDLAFSIKSYEQKLPKSA